MSEPRRETVLQLCTVLPATQNALDARYTVVQLPSGVPSAEMDTWFETHGAVVRGVVTGGHLGIETALAERLPSLGIVAINGVGYDRIDLPAMRRLGVRVSNTPDVLTDDVADLAIALMLNVMRRLPAAEANLSRWRDLVHRAYHPSDEVKIGVIGKYVEYEDSYKSLKEALVHGALAEGLKLRLEWIEAQSLEVPDSDFLLEGYDGILVPGGFGKRGIEGMLNAIRFARETKTPYFGICLGMQTACIEYARNVCGLERANSGEFDPQTPFRVIYKLRELTGVEEMGGTMRLGAWECVLQPGSLAARAYGMTKISERHRHRYEFNREFEQPLTEGGLRLTGASESGTYVEIVEIPDHPFFLGCQFHPEFKSKPLEPHPLFHAFIKASYSHRGLRAAQRLVEAEIKA